MRNYQKTKSATQSKKMGSAFTSRPSRRTDPGLRELSENPRLIPTFLDFALYLAL